MNNRGTIKNYTFMLLMVFALLGILFYSHQITKQINDIVQKDEAPAKAVPTALSAQKRWRHASLPVIDPTNDPLAPRTQIKNQNQNGDPRSRTMDRLKPAENFPPAPANPLMLEG